MFLVWCPKLDYADISVTAVSHLAAQCSISVPPSPRGDGAAISDPPRPASPHILVTLEAVDRHRCVVTRVSGPGNVKMK